MQEFLDFVVKGLVEHPEEVAITPVERNGMTIYELRVNSADMGRIIGKQGVT
ncbi:MAG TPA: KH domain-containing protein, partial [Methylomirabilota bacterium]|nr:KH domain-containing protein [Methylomirabilota bacterium]